MAPELGVVIVHYGDPAPTRRAVAAVRADPSPVTRRVVVVDNSASFGPDPETTGSAGADGAGEPDGANGGAGVEILVAADNPGFGAGANRGVDRLAAAGAAPAGYLVLNGDVEILPGYLAAAAEAVALGGAAAGPIHLDRTDGPLWYAGGRILLWTGTVVHSRRPADARQARAVGFLPGAACVVARQAWDEVGGFDPGFFLYNEDVDLCLRLRAAGYPLRFVPAMRAVHHLGAATGSRRRSALYLEHLARTRLRPYRSRPHRLWLAFLHSGWVALRAGSILLTRGSSGWPRVRALLRGHRDAVAGAWHRR